MIEHQNQYPRDGRSGHMMAKERKREMVVAKTERIKMDVATTRKEGKDLLPENNI